MVVRRLFDSHFNRYKGAELIGDEEKQAVLEVLESRSLFRYYGPDLRYKVAGFEAAFAHYLDTPFVAASSSGTAALRAGLAALGVGAGDEVIVPAVTFIASVGAIVAQHAIPIFAEVDAMLTLDPAAIEPLLTERTRAIMPVHLSGIAADMDPIMDLARRAGIAVIEDAAQACGSFYKGRRVWQHRRYRSVQLSTRKEHHQRRRWRDRNQRRGTV